MENNLTTTAPSTAPAKLPNGKFAPVAFPSPGLRATPPRLRTFNSEALYADTLTELKLYIEGEYATVKNFCETFNIDRYNLSKCFTAINNGSGKEMSVGLYLRIMVALGMIDPCELGDVSAEDADAMNRLFPMSLREYLLVNNNAVMKSLMMILYS